MNDHRKCFLLRLLMQNAARRWNRTSSRVQFHTSVCLVQVSVSLYLCVPLGSVGGLASSRSLYLCVPSAQQGVWPRP
ncbi:hypothetical protein KUCAC02_027835, partial [Chaenocephalus aceratus]